MRNQPRADEFSHHDGEVWRDSLHSAAEVLRELQSVLRESDDLYDNSHTQVGQAGTVQEGVVYFEGYMSRNGCR